MIRKVFLVMAVAVIGNLVLANSASAGRRGGRCAPCGCYCPCQVPWQWCPPCYDPCANGNAGSGETERQRADSDGASGAADGNETKASRGDEVTPDEEKEFNKMYDGTPADDLQILKKGWATKSHAERKQVWDKYQKAVKDAEEKANKKQQDKQDKKDGDPSQGLVKKPGHISRTAGVRVSMPGADYPSTWYAPVVMYSFDMDWTSYYAPAWPVFVAP